MKKLLIVFALISVMLLPTHIALADTAEDNLKENIETQLDDIDFSGMDDYVYEGMIITTETEFEDIVNGLINGEYNYNASTLIGKIVGNLFKQLKSILPLLVTIVAVAILGNMVSAFQPVNNTQSISKMVHLVCMGVVIVLVVGVVKNVYDVSTHCINLMTSQMSILFPILLTLLTGLGSVVTVGIYKPVVALLTTGVMSILKYVVYPIFLLSFVFVILDNLSDTIKLKKMTNFLHSSFKWIVGFVFTLFGGFLTIQGISAGKYDKISLTATRFAMKSYVPIIGGYLSDGLDYVMLTGIIIKNAVGVAGLLIMLGTILIPIITILVLKLGLQLVAGVIDIMGDSKVSGMCEDISKILVYLIVVILAIAFMYTLSVGLIMCTVSGV